MCSGQISLIFVLAMVAIVLGASKEGCDPAPCTCGYQQGNICGSRNIPTNNGLYLSGNCHERGLYQCQGRGRPAELKVLCAGVCSELVDGEDRCMSGSFKQKKSDCTCGFQQGNICGNRSSSDGLYLSGTCFGHGLYQCQGRGRPAELKVLCAGQKCSQLVDGEDRCMFGNFDQNKQA